mmetsp:Transcript_9785/g.33199  ORF Transcript_9785/g.33199 Transcript_9785/m.33199 type:complete len:228 (-) Transcript_9785:1198-1881(-)
MSTAARSLRLGFLRRGSGSPRVTATAPSASGPTRRSKHSSWRRLRSGARCSTSPGPGTGSACAPWARAAKPLVRCSPGTRATPSGASTATPSASSRALSAPSGRSGSPRARTISASTGTKARPSSSRPPTGSTPATPTACASPATAPSWCPWAPTPRCSCTTARRAPWPPSSMPRRARTATPGPYSPWPGPPTTSSCSPPPRTRPSRCGTRALGACCGPSRLRTSPR